MYTTLISVEQLQTLQKSGQAVLVFDCSFELMKPAEGDAQYAASHIAGALRADLDRHLSVHGAADAASAGRHPLPSRVAFAAWLGSVGLTPDTQAVVYDRQGVNYSGRLWWMLKWAGHEASAVLQAKPSSMPAPHRASKVKWSRSTRWPDTFPAR
ncbi:MAG: thiosulfate/3-mercaptopyruvate sulfurtransferase [Comamonadaceae bacterium]|nr:MAG: thiosulfate/3-mercaptopyruvate sulfurtransferase [Comamonadaceae bacterium]